MENLLITTICRSDAAVFSELTKLAGVNECHVNYSHVYTLGNEQSVTLQITGNWSGIAKIESTLPSIAKRLSIEFISKRGHPEKIERYHLPYRIEIVAVDQPGLVYDIAEFLNSLEVLIERFETFTSMHQQTPILKLHIHLEIPADNNIADIREQFLVFCDELNLDGMLEPQK